MFMSNYGACFRRRHQTKSNEWLFKKYWTASGRKHVFSVILKYKGKKHLLQVVRICSIGIRRHIKIKADANPYMPEYAGYFWRRRHNKEARLLGALIITGVSCYESARGITAGLSHKGRL